jgi:hypothetical protein
MHNILKRIASGEAECAPLPKHVAITKIESPLPRHTLNARTSQPIPIKFSSKAARLESYAFDEQERQAEKYDLATWNMYVRIVSARQLRAANLNQLVEDEKSSSHDSCTQSIVNSRPRSVSITEESDEHPPVPPVDEPRPTDLDELSHNECYADTIFELELE